MTAPAIPPGEDALRGLPTDDWALLLPVARRVLREVRGQVPDEDVEQLLALPGSRLVAGRGRDRLVAVLRRPVVWSAVRAELPPQVLASLDAAHDEAVVDPAEHAALQQRATHLAERVEVLDERLRLVRAERDEALDAAARSARDAAAAQELAQEAEQAGHEARRRAAELAAGLAEADEQRARAVARERRRAESADRQQEDELTAARREAQELRAEVRELRRRLSQRPSAPSRPARTSSASDDDGAAAATTGRRGRPSQLPDDLVAGTTPATRWLLARGRLVLVDGYNVSRTHRDGLDLEGQRRWLVDGLRGLVARRGVEVVVVFDAGGRAGRTTRPVPGLTVRFTEPELTADDELVFEVGALPGDTPVVVVTDDRELRERLAVHRVDLLHTRELLPLLS